MGLSWSKIQANRNAKALRELAPKKTPGHDTPLPDLTRDTLTKALTNVAKYISKKGGNVTIIAVGGAVNTIYLKSRTATHDLDFFNERLTTKDLELLVKGAREAAKYDHTLKEQWFNNRTVFFIPRDRRDALTTEAYQQADVIFRQPGLTVLAAPWYYALCCKMDRIAGGGLHPARSYDLDDAITYLRSYLRKRGQGTVSRTVIQSWFAQLSLSWSINVDQVISRINSGYKARYQVNFNVIT
ncbi:hypothetical protein N0V93_002207 [Gnomoniopsis smithogilvyi]|uniref:DUF7582 domain-containing protein n=1 Tax=Gnomoniopsis smithogilvyi TaxID=1191159 RepID=A0A9W8YX49_9PEZI|nr:hypothetical protein N0V93_002207 [Gnomoniopsis smithogilvyi]